MPDAILVAKLAISLICGAAGVWLAQSPAVGALTDRRFDRLMILVWVASRLGLYTAVFGLFRMKVSSDVSVFYYPEALHALKGEVIYRDFTSNYAPFFPYLTALILKLWNSEKALVLAAILIDGCNLILWLQIARTTWPGRAGRLLMTFYVLSSFAILDVAIAGQNQVWIAALLSLAVWSLGRRSKLLPPAIAGLTVLLIKFLPLLYMPLFFRRKSAPLRTLTAAVALPVAVYGILWVNGIDILQPVRMQRALITSGNIPYLLSFLKVSETAEAAIQTIVLLSLAGLCIYWFTRPGPPERKQIVFGLVIFTFACALLNKKFSTNYLMMIFAPICTVAAVTSDASVTGALRFFAFNLVIALEPSLWFRFLHGEEYNSRLWQLVPALARSGALWKLWFFVSVDLLLLGFYAYYLLKAWTLLRQGLREPHAGSLGGAANHQVRQLL